MAKKVKKKEPLLRKQDFASYLETKAREMAPRDVEVLLSQAQKAQSSAYAISERIGNQMSLALELLDDHQNGECPQIPFYTVSLLAEAVYYFLDPNDVIPDWIPEIGRIDDALVLELAFEFGVDGVRRYCAWKDIDDSGIYPALNKPAPVASSADVGKPAGAKKAASAKKSVSAKKLGASKSTKGKAKPKKVAKSVAKPTRRKSSKSAAKRRSPRS